MEYINLFVPGRVSIIGELSDLVVDYKSMNKNIISGEVIAGGIDKGIYASISKSKDFRFEFNNKYFIAENMNLEILEKEAKSGNFFSYVSSCAYIMKEKYNVSGIDVKVRYMSLPLQKGLSSSAAVCVLVIKAFSELYNLNIEYMDIMELAYIAERNALSMCGRLDQICAKGLCLSHIIFNENDLEVYPVDIKEELNFVITDLNGFKDTKEILSQIHKCFPFPKNENEELVRKTLCEDNKHLVRESIKAIQTGNKKYLGEILIQIQQNLDNSIGKICAAFEGPLLHKTMNDEIIKKNSYGSKGTGSNGDGSIIILAKNKKSQKDIIDYLKKEYDMNSFEFNINKTYDIKSSIINTLDENFKEEELINILEELDNLGIENILLVGKESLINKYKNILNKLYTDEEFNNLSLEEKEYQIKLYRIYNKMQFIISNKFSKKNISNYKQNKPVLYITSYNKNEFENLLDNYKNNNKEIDLSKNTII